MNNSNQLTSGQMRDSYDSESADAIERCETVNQLDAMAREMERIASNGGHIQIKSVSVRFDNYGATIRVTSVRTRHISSR